MRYWITCLFCICLTPTILADNAPDQAQVDAAYAQLRAAQVAATQPANISHADLDHLKAELVLLRAEIQRLRSENMELKTQVAVLRKQVQNTGTVAAPMKQGQDPSKEKKIVLSAGEFNALPLNKVGGPLGFANLKANSIGYVDSAVIVRVIDESTAIVEYVTADEYGRRDVNFKQQFVIEGMPTTNQADDTAWSLHQWFKIIGTQKVDDTTYFVAWPIVQAEKATIHKP